MTFYINDKLSQRAECRAVSLFGQKVCSHCRDQSKSKASFHKRCPLICGNLENLFLQRSGPNSNLDLPRLWRRKNTTKQKWLARASSKVRTQTRWIHEAYSWITGLCGHIKPRNLWYEIMCSEFIFVPACESLEKRSTSKKKIQIRKMQLWKGYTLSNFLFYGLPPMIRSITCNKLSELLANSPGKRLIQNLPLKILWSSVR